jgi:hypothetical protein
MLATTSVLMVPAAVLLLLLVVAAQHQSHAFMIVALNKPNECHGRTLHGLKNIYDDWRADAVVDTMYLCDENVEECLEEFIRSDYGSQMFGYVGQERTIRTTQLTTQYFDFSAQ